MKDSADPDTRGYPSQIGQIVLTKCSTSGCHNSASYEAAGGLNLSSWADLFKGGNGSAAVIPYRADFSTMCYYINTFPELGPTLQPTMPLNNTPLSKEEVVQIQSWINAGAPDKSGKIAFAENPNRRKIYVLNQGCRVVTVIDEETLLPMRYVDVESGNTSPHMIRITPDGNYWYVISIGGSRIRRFSTTDDKFAGEAAIPVGNYNTFVITADSKKAYLVDFSATGRIIEVNLENMSLANNYTTSDWTNIHGSALSPDGQFLYITSQLQNRIFKIPLNDFSNYSEIVLNTAFSATIQGVTDPHEIIFSPNGLYYYVSCTASNEVRVFNAANDAFVTSIATGTYPQEFAISVSTSQLFVACTEDVANLTAPTTGKKGVITAIDLNTNTLIQHIDARLYQPHGITVDEAKGLIIVASRNQESNGPAPHHTTNCGGRNGFVTFIGLTDFQKKGNTVEVSVDPYSVVLRE